jgi:hypothetical protein
MLSSSDLARIRPAIILVLSLVLPWLMSSGSAMAYTIYEKDDFKIKYAGHLQHLTSSSDDPYYDVLAVPTMTGVILVPVQGHSTDNTSRARSTFRFLTGTMVSGEVSVDATYTFGSVLGSYLFQLQKDMDPPTYFNWEKEWIDEDARYGKASVYRATITVEAEKYRLIFGRQRLAYGTALFWSPIDIWNPVSPLALEPEEKVGVDGASAIWWLSDDLSMTGLAALADEWDEARLAGSLSWQIQSYTLDFLAGKNREDGVYGFDFVGNLGGAGFRGEFTWTVADKDDDYPRAVAGIDYAWPNTLYLALEYYHNGGPLEIDWADPFSAFLENTGVDTLNRNFAGLMASYNLDPLVVATIAVILDTDHGSEVFAPSINWSAGGHLTISAGAQFFEGAIDGEYGSYPDLGWLRVRWDI